MSTRSFGQILTVAFGVSLSSVALARNPPALVKQQEAAAQATQTSGGYRDITARFGAVPERTPEVMRSAGGYRDIHYRFGATQTADQSASATSSSRYR